MSGSTSRFGCLGCSWVAAMVFGSVVLSATLIWIAPQWLQPILFWNEPPQPPEAILISEELLTDDGETEPAANPETEVEKWQRFAVAAEYREAEGIELTTLGGSTFHLPPGAISGDRPVTITPVTRVPGAMVQDGAIPVGPVFHLQIGGEEHWSFDRPIEVSVPFDPAVTGRSFEQARPTLAVWETDRWRPLPTAYDAGRATLRADVPHASIVGLLWGVGKGVAIGWAIVTTEPAQAIWQQLKSKCDAVYSTDNFDLNYLSAGKDGAPMPDSDYLDHTAYNGKKHDGHPRYITDLGDFLEDGRKWLPDVRMSVPEVWFDRYEAFVIPLDDFGASKLGGPLIISTTMEYDGKLPANLAYDMRRTCVHELIHVAQDESISNLQDFALDLRWWIETTAEHLSIKLMKARAGQANPKPFFYTSRSPRLPAVGLDGSTELQPYAYARLLDWMEANGVDTVDAIQAVNSRWKISEKALDEEIRKRNSKGLGLSDYHATFAREYYLANAWTGSMTGRDKARLVYDLGRFRFPVISTLVRGNYVARFYDEIKIEEPAVVSKIYAFDARSLPKRRQTHLVVQVEAPLTANATSIFYAEQRGNPPYDGKPPAFAVHYARPVATIMSSKKMASGRNLSDDYINRMTVVVNHGSFASDDAPITVRRWMLMAPEWVSAFRQNDGNYAVSWHQAEIKSAADGAAFIGYDLYRRPFGATEFPNAPVNFLPLTDEFYVDNPPSDGFWEYTVRVVDSAGNLSEPAPIDTEGDPFVGTWEGRLRLIEGSVAELATRTLRAEIARSGGGQPEGVEALIAAFEGMLTAVNLMLRIGVPVTFEVSNERGKYVVRPVKAMGKPVGDAEELVLDRLGLSTIGMLPKTPQGDAVLLSLSAKDEINREYYDTIENDPDIGTMRFGLKVAFKRTNSTPP